MRPEEHGPNVDAYTPSSGRRVRRIEVNDMKRLIIALLFPLALIAGCAGGLGAATYSRSEAGQVGTVQHATILSLRPVRIEGTKSNIGTAAGAVAGGIAA